MAKLALGEEVLRSERLLNWCVAIRPRREAVALGKLRERRGDFASSRDPVALAAELPGVLRYAGERVYRKLGGAKAANAWRFNAMTEQAPNRDSRVVLSEQRNASGEPRVSLDWRLSEFDLDSIFRAQQILAHEVSSSGLGRLVTPYSREELS